MARFKRKTARRKSTPARRVVRRRRRGTIGTVMARRRSAPRSGGGIMGTAMEVLTLTGGVVAGQALGKLLSEKVPQLADGKLRGAAMLGIGILGAKYAPRQLRGVAIGVAVSGGYQLAKELMPQMIAGGIGALSAADVELIEQMALESEVQGLEDNLTNTMNGDGMDANVVNTVTGNDDDDDDEDY